MAAWVDAAPRSYNFLGRGVQTLKPIQVYVNLQSMPRAFVVPTAIPEAAEVDVLEQLKSLDFWQTATLAAWDSKRHPMPAPRSRRPWLTVHSDKPNEVAITLDGRSAGLLVLTDPWYPGWVCRIDGQDVPIWKADYAFRGVIIPVGSRDVVFRFEPQSYRRGKWISLCTLAAVVLFFGLAGSRNRRGA